MGGKFTAIAEVFHDKTTSYFSTEFKHDAALLVLDQVGESALRRWVDQLRIERDGGIPKSKALTPEQQKIQELEARIGRLERKKVILKKATALLLADELDRSR